MDRIKIMQHIGTNILDAGMITGRKLKEYINNKEKKHETNNLIFQFYESDGELVSHVYIERRETEEEHKQRMSYKTEKQKEYEHYLTLKSKYEKNK